jgi:hypothetical protein
MSTVKADFSNNHLRHMAEPMSLARDVAPQSAASPLVPVHLTSAQGVSAKLSKQKLFR